MGIIFDQIDQILDISEFECACGFWIHSKNISELNAKKVWG